jgi:hypothetical protein
MKLCNTLTYLIEVKEDILLRKILLDICLLEVMQIKMEYLEGTEPII